MTATSITLYGIEFKFSDFSGDGYKGNVTIDGEDYPRWAAMFIAGLKDIDNVQATTSASSNTIGTGTKTFVLAEDVRYQIGQKVLIARTSSPSTYFYGTVTSYTQSTKTLIVNVTQTSGSGTHSDWTVNISPPQATFGLSSVSRAVSTALSASDSGSIIFASTSGTQAINAISTLPTNWIVFYVNDSTGTITIDPNSSEQINGQSTINILPGESVWLQYNGTVLQTLNFFSPHLWISDTIADPQNGDYTITFMAPVAGKIEYLETKTQSGTCTVQFKINGTNCGSAISTTSTKATQSVSSSNSYAAGDTISLTVSSFSSAVNLSLNVRSRRTY